MSSWVSSLPRNLESSFPLLLPERPEGPPYALSGWITCDGREWDLRVVLDITKGSNELRVEGTRLEIGAELQEVLRGYEGVVARKVAQAHDLGELLFDVRDHVERVLRGKRIKPNSAAPSIPALPKAAFYKRLVSEVDALRECGALGSVNVQLDEVEIRVTDVAGRLHSLMAKLPPDYPDSAPVCVGDLPEALALTYWDSSCTLTTALSKLREAVEHFQEFWNVLDDLDRHVWVLEPEKPSRASCMRRISVAPHCSVMIQVNPAFPTHVPQIRFLGADKVVQPLVQSFNARSKDWSQAAQLRSNLELCLNIVFPSASNSKKEDFLHDQCAICYEYRLAESVPDVVCGTARCNQAFHRQCLYEWLRAIPSSKTSFSTVFGQCPFCEGPISVQMK